MWQRIQTLYLAVSAVLLFILFFSDAYAVSAPEGMQYVTYLQLQKPYFGILLGILLLWFVVQFLYHWYFTIFGASESKLKGYNDCFRGTVRIFPMSETRLIPDLYHIVLHILILLNIIACLAAP